MKLLFSAISVAASVVLSGCATQNVKEADKLTREQEAVIKKAQADHALKPETPIYYTEKSYVPLRKVDKTMHNAQQRAILGTEIETNRNFSNLNEVATWLTTIASVPVYISPELIAPPTSQPGMPGSAPVAMPVSAMAGQTTSVAQLTAANKPLQVSFSGNLNGFLDVVAANYGIFWAMEGKSLRFLLNESRTFRIKALPGDTALRSTVNAATNTSGNSGTVTQTGTSTGGADNTTGISFSGMSVWTGLDASIKQILTPITGKVAVSPATGSITVTDTPRVLDKVAELIKEHNAALSRQVALNVKVLSVELNDSEDYGINWSAAFNSLSSNTAFRFNTAFPVSADAAQFVLSTATPSSNSWGSASGAIMSALSTIGRVSEMTSSTVVTLNNQPAPVNVGRQVSYLASSTSTVTASVGSTVTLQPGQVQTGFSMVVLPHILDGREMLLQTSVNLSSLLQLATITSGGSSIQSPDIATSNFIQRVKLNSGDTLVLAGFDQDNLSAVAQGVGDANNWAAGSRKTAKKRTKLVILVQPTVSL